MRINHLRRTSQLSTVPNITTQATVLGTVDWYLPLALAPVTQASQVTVQTGRLVSKGRVSKDVTTVFQSSAFDLLETYPRRPRCRCMYEEA